MNNAVIKRFSWVLCTASVYRAGLPEKRIMRDLLHASIDNTQLCRIFPPSCCAFAYR